MDDQNFIYTTQGKKWVLPKILVFGNRPHKFKTHMGFLPNHCEYKVIGYRKPKEGEWYLSGAIVGAYKAPNDLNMVYLIAEPTRQMKPETITVFKPI